MAQKNSIELFNPRIATTFGTKATFFIKHIECQEFWGNGHSKCITKKLNEGQKYYHKNGNIYH